MTIGVGIAGYGLSGSVFHGPLLSQLESYKIKAVMTKSQATQAQQDFPQAEIVANYADLLSNDEINLIVLALPNDMHFDFAKRALLAGKHVLVEKPFVPNSAEGRELAALAKEQNKVLTVYHNRRYDGDFLTLQKVLRNEELGLINYFESHFDRFKQEVDQRWKEQDRVGGGVLFDLGSHLIDQVLLLFGKPQAIFADISCQRPQAINPDYFHLIFEYKTMRAVLHASTLASYSPFRFLVHGAKGSFLKKGLDPQEARLKEKKARIDVQSIGKDHPENFADIFLPSGKTKKLITEPGNYLLFYEKLAQAIQENSSPPVSAEDGQLVIEMIEACQQSSVDRKWIEI